MSVRRVLYIEDNEDALKLVELLIRRGGYDFAGARNGIEGLAKIVEFEPDVLLLDLMMPDIDGLEILRRLRANPETRHTAVIIITASGPQARWVQEAQNSEIDAYFLKPFVPKRLLEAVGQAITRRQG